jgi:hypothetical protein
MIRVSLYWLGVSAIYLAASFLLLPVSLPISSILRFPVGIFLFCSIYDPIELLTKAGQKVRPAEAKHIVV